VRTDRTRRRSRAGRLERVDASEGWVPASDRRGEPLPPGRTGASGQGRLLASERLGGHLDRLFAAAYALCGSREDAEDLVQETYARVLRRPRFVRAGGERAYLLRVLRNVWYDTASTLARRHEAAAAPEMFEFVADVRGDPEILSEARAAYSAIAELSVVLRETIVAVDIVGLSYKEAARALGTGTGTIMSRLYSARHRVAASLEGRAA
jgi:RNA polymerase sigma-70 factor (ECF subfamily)